MLLLYSGSLAPNGDSNADQSLGGFISGTSLPSGSVGNLFSMITKSSIQKNLNECKLLVFQNNSGSTITGVRVWTETDDGALFLLKLAFVAPAYDAGCKRYFFEQILSPNQIPMQGTFGSYEGESNAASEDNIPDQGYLGIWIQRQYTTDALARNTVVKDGACDSASITALQNQMTNDGSILSNNFNLIIDWA